MSHDALEVVVEVLHHHVHLVKVGPDHHLQHPYDVWVVQAEQHVGLSQGGDREALLPVVPCDLHLMGGGRHENNKGFRQRGGERRKTQHACMDVDDSSCILPIEIPLLATTQTEAIHNFGPFASLISRHEIKNNEKKKKERLTSKLQHGGKLFLSG